MFSNIGGLEIVFVMVVALIVLGPTKLPEAARQVGKFANQVRQISSGFQREFREAIQDPIVEAEARAKGAIESTKIQVTGPFQGAQAPPDTNAKSNGASAGADDTATADDTAVDRTAVEPGTEAGADDTAPPSSVADND
ncbi:MAG: Sec-independent protein translocase protein TatB [Actinomycetota bacterium]